MIHKLIQKSIDNLKLPSYSVVHEETITTISKNDTTIIYVQFYKNDVDCFLYFSDSDDWGCVAVDYSNPNLLNIIEQHCVNFKW